MSKSESKPITADYIRNKFEIMLPYAITKKGKLIAVDWQGYSFEQLKWIYDTFNAKLDELNIDRDHIDEKEKPYYRGLGQKILADVIECKPAVVVYGL